MSSQNETFFTSIGCMDGRVQDPIAVFGREKFGVQFADTITEAGLVGILGKDDVDDDFLEALKTKIDISLGKHGSKGIVVHGHQECAGNPVDDNTHKDDIRKSIDAIKLLVNPQVPVIGVFVKRAESGWTTEEVPQTAFA